MNTEEKKEKLIALIEHQKIRIGELISETLNKEFSPRELDKGIEETKQLMAEVVGLADELGFEIPEPVAELMEGLEELEENIRTGTRPFPTEYLKEN